jgi:nucleoside-diphosphate-sugar epimerase
MDSIDTSAPVLVTGATGYVAGWLVKALLDSGVHVHAAVRDPDDAVRTAHLTNLAANAPGDITFFKADLLDPGSFAEAMAGCKVVFHTASPFTSKITDPQKDLVDPALNGTRNVLEEATRQASVERVVVTSSCAAIYGDNADLAQAPGGVLTEAIWNTSSSLDHMAYSYSKTVAERAAWEIANAQDRWRLVVVNPSFVLGPALQPRPTSESFTLMKGFGDGTFKSGAPRIGIGTVDVRDLAGAHVRAGFLPDAEGRHIISHEETDFLGLADGLQDRYGRDYPLPKGPIPKWLAWLVGPMLNPMTTRRYIARNVDIEWHADNSKSVEKLAMTYRPLKETLEDMFAFMIEAGFFKRE